MITMEFTCTDKRSHTSRVLRRINLMESGTGTTANEVAMQRLNIAPYWDSKRGDNVQDLRVDDALAGRPGAVPTVLPFTCPSCPLDRQIRYVELVTLIERLHAAGVSSVDVSVLPAKIVGS